MSFNNSQEAEARPRNPVRLTTEEVRDLMPHTNQISETGMRRLKADLVLQNIMAVQSFEKNTSRLTRWLIVLTVVLLILALVVAFIAVLLAHAPNS